MTNYNHVANYCMDNPEHPMFRARDGACCVECNGMVNVKPVTKSQYDRLPTYIELRYERKHKKVKGIMQIDVDMNTDKLQRKLLTIANHLEALAQELDAIDGDKDYINIKTTLDGKVLSDELIKNKVLMNADDAPWL